MNVSRSNRLVFLSWLFLFLCLEAAVSLAVVCNNCCDDHQNVSEPRRSTKSVWQTGQIALCDMNIRSGWYRFTSFGGAKMPESVVPQGYCGTHDPIWLNGKHPTVTEGNVIRTVCINSFGLNNGCYDHFDINVKNCGGYYVYYLKPLYYCAAAYCAGFKELCPYGKEGEPPDCYDPPKEFSSDYIGDPSINYIVVQESPSVPLICKAPLFNGIGTWANVTYLVQWFANGAPLWHKKRCSDGVASCPQEDYIKFKLEGDMYKIGQTISCNISAKFTTSPKNVWSTPKYTRTPFFVGLQVNQTALNIPTLKTCDPDNEYVVAFTPTIPVRVYTDPQGNKRYPKITFYAPQDVNIKQSCEATLKELEPVYLTVTAACSQVSKPGLKLIVPIFRQTTRFWNQKYSLPKVWINIRKQTDIQQCKSVTDPHYTSFKGRYYTYMGRGDYILYRNTERYFEVQTRQWTCASGSGWFATCNCAAVVRDHNDVIEFTICSDSLRYNEITPIRYRILSRKCLSPGASIKRKISGGSVDYEVMFRSGAKVEIIRNDWGIDVLLFTPRATSAANESGLCLDPQQNIQAFGDQWRLENGKSLFHILPPLVDEYKVTYSQTCACLQDTENSPRHCRDPFPLAYPTLFKGGKNMAPLSPAFLCDVQKRDVSLSDDPTDEDFKLFSQTPQLRLRVKRDAVFEVSKENATRYCAERISETKIGKLCAKVGVNVQALANICSVDIQYTGDFSFASGSIAVLMKECGNLAARNLSILANISGEENGPTGSNFVEEIAELLCPNDCSFNGKCVNGSCVCNKEFTADDCSASIYQIPTILTLQGDGLCDKRQRPCRKVTVLGTGFINSTNMTCHVKEFKVVEGAWTPNNTEQKFPGEMTDLLLADCFLPESPVMQGFFHETNEGVPAAGLVITVSNDGGHKSSENLTFISYDSACMSCNISTGCVLKNNSCFINRYCFAPNETNPIDWCYQCLPEVSTNAWTKRQVNLPPQLPTTTNYYVVSGEYLELPVEVSDPEGMPVIVTLIDGSPSGATIHDNVLLWNATSEILTIFALKATDACQGYSLLNITVGLVSCQCKNNGSCVPHPNKPRGSGYYACDCIPGFTGAMCETEIDECQSFPCFRGYCLDGINNFTCVCDPGYVGWTCNTDYDDCTTSPCVYGNCTDLIADYGCNCNAGYGGKNCSIDIDECESSPCTRGTCVDGVNSFTCVCEDGYGGYLCDFEINECQSSPCVHGTCLDKINSFYCNCEAGFTGARCEVNIDDCLKSPCGNAACGGTLTALRGNITSPSYPDVSPRNKHCLWKITVPDGQRISLKFNHFQLKRRRYKGCRYEYVKIRDKDDQVLGKFCGGKIPQTVTSSSNAMSVEFRSHHTQSRAGFVAEYYAVNHCGGTLNALSGEITSPNYPGTYRSNRDCTWKIVAPAGNHLELTFKEIDIEERKQNKCPFDYVEVFSGSGKHTNSLGRFCGKQRPKTLISRIHKMVVKFRSDKKVNVKGFRAEYKAECGSQLRASSHKRQFVSHPSYGDDNYKSNHRCLWLLTARSGHVIFLRFKSFDVEYERMCGYDYVEIYDGSNRTSPTLGKICGSESQVFPRLFTSRGNRMFIQFRTDLTNQKKGFVAEYWRLRKRNRRKS